MPTVYCPGCDQQVEPAATGRGQPARCPNCGAPLAPRQGPIEAELVPDDEGVTREPRAERQRPYPRDWDEDDDFRLQPRPRIRRGKRGGRRFLNATTFGAVLGFLGPACVWALFIVASGGGGRMNEVLATALIGGACFGVIGCAIGVVVGWVIDALIHAVRVASADEGSSRRDTSGRPRRSRREEDEG